jgi:hypothetical protein
MLLFATSDKGGTGRSVTSCNMVYRRALQGSNVAYVDFDFGSPTAGAIFEITSVATGTDGGGLHSFLQGRTTEPLRLDVWTASDRSILRQRPLGAGDLWLFPGDRGGGEFGRTKDAVHRCTKFFLRLEEEFDVTLIDLSAGRSHAVDMALEVTSQPELRKTMSRWLVYHRWTRQHIVAAAGLVFGERGILQTGIARGHDEDRLRDSIRFVRTAVVDPNASEFAQMRPAQAAWLRDCNRDLQELAARHRLGRSVTLGHTPMDPVLQWREQLISDEDVVSSRIANPATSAAFDDLARRVTDTMSWEPL